MAWLCPALLCALTLSGCFALKTKYVHFDVAFTESEQAETLRAIDEWNEISLRFPDRPGLAYKYAGDFYEDFSWYDLGDDTHVIYKIVSLDDTVPDGTWDPNGPIEDYSGYGTRGDVLMFVVNICADLGLPAGEECYNDPEYVELFHHVVAHELGHMLSLPHYYNEPGLMNTRDEYYEDGPTEADEREFRFYYHCPR